MPPVNKFSDELEYSDMQQTIRDGVRDGASNKTLAELLSYSQSVLPDLI